VTVLGKVVDPHRSDTRLTPRAAIEKASSLAVETAHFCVWLHRQTPSYFNSGHASSRCRNSASFNQNRQL